MEVIVSNCLIFALTQFFKRGGYIVIRKSKFGPWLHFMWTDSIDSYEHYKPHEKLKYPVISKFLFKGKVEKRNEKDNSIQ